ncbi:hypothetical protein [Pseudodesulfovibrio portus]|uniref:Uncharacterized protein n=1 Tax=Pseudodesulfovibrio portus TaxID=231439 RepID=A0ABM8AQX9_9BACT|nr:hypothetical protein [Pseudodesulfovibrio portus]BDQ33816.1 hypothetical protein JCM14722_13580 [Pseudodesulfovibrio portus]
MQQSAIYVILAVFLTGAFFTSAAQAQSEALASPPVETASIQDSDTESPGKSALTVLKKDLARKQQQLVTSALEWMATANTHLLPSRRKPRIEKQSDGTYKAVYFMRRQYLEEEVAPGMGKLFEVTKEQHGYSGLFRFVEVVYEARGSSPEECRAAEFTPKVRRPNAQIFCYSGGRWQ